MQRQHIIQALRKTKGKVTGIHGAAELLQINGKTLASKMRKLNIHREDYRQK
jgi:transcriptional regulator with GAF, ATPase, and Fis domain